MDTVDRISWLYRIDVRLQASTKDTTARQLFDNDGLHDR